MAKRKRRVSSVKNELIKKSRESTLAAVQIFNNPNITFKAETYIVLMIIGWTYLMHAYYRNIGKEYRYYTMKGSKRRFDRTKYGAFKYWELEKCINNKTSPLDSNTKNNLLFVIGLRHEIEHQMTTRIDDLLSARFQACCLNFNHYIKKFFGGKFGIENHLSFSLQFSTIETEQKDLLSEHPYLPANIQTYIRSFDDVLTESEFSSQQYAYRILFTPKTANRKGQADRVIEFVRSDSPLIDKVNKEYALIKETEKPKYLATQVIEKVHLRGYPKFGMYQHTQLWKSLDGKNPSKGFGTMVADKDWRWYEVWIEKVLSYCSIKGKEFV